MEPTPTGSPAPAPAPEPGPSGASPIVAARLFRPDEVVERLARAYHDAAARDAEMRAAVDILERARAAMATESDPFAIWMTLDGQVGRCEADRLLPVVRQLRDDCVKDIVDRVIGRVADAFRRGAAIGWPCWTWAYSRALQDGRDTFLTALAAAAMPEPGEYAGRLDALGRQARHIAHERWGECRDGLILLSEQPGLDARQRAAAMGLVGQIHLALFGDTRGGLEWLDRAEAMAADVPEVLIGRVRYWLAREDPDEAAGFARRAVEAAPGRSEGYSILGECEEAAGDLKAAESHYMEAVGAAGGSASAYLPLIRFYGRPELFEARRDRLQAMAARARAVDASPSAEYVLLLTEAWNDRRNGRDLEGIDRITRAIQMDSQRLGGYLDRGMAYLELADRPGRPENSLERAEDDFNEAISVAREACDGYWFLALLRERQGRLEEGLELCRECLERQPRLAGRFQAKRADLLRQLGRIREAEAAVIRALWKDRSETGADSIPAMRALAESHYRERGDREAAMRLYRRARRARGAAFEAEYRNLVGNLHYYFKEYAEAARAYREAIESSQAADRTAGAEAAAARPRAAGPSPGLAVYHSNLAGAIEQMPAPADERLKQLDEILAELQQAIRLDPGNAAYRERLDGTGRRRRFLLRYGGAALDFRPSYPPIQPVLEAGLLSAAILEANGRLRGEILGRIAAMRADFKRRFGLTLPGVTFTDISGETPPPGTYRLAVAGEYREQGIIPPGRLFATADAGPGDGPDPTGEPPVCDGPSPPPRGLWLDEGQAALARGRGRTLLGPDEYLLERLRVVLEGHLADLVDYQMTADLLRQSAAPGRDEILGVPGRLLELARILRGLLDRRASIADLGAIVAATGRGRPPGAAEDELVAELASTRSS